ncbi:MAG: molybdenum cofactor guanylyltransferase [Gemmatimonadota bacterium]|nr:molybdenum cofactor guanylyltransferase [Gemmatimonadota bacterium]
MVPEEARSVGVSAHTALEPRRAPVTGVILAGGEASRYGGRPKGLEQVAGRRILDRVADALTTAADDLLLIANDPDAEAWLPGVRTATDVRPGLGSLGGIHSALVRAGRPVLLVAWDMPFVPASLLALLRDRGRDADVAVPESGSRRGVEPLCAYYAPACVAPIEQRLAADDLRVVGFFDDVRVTRIDADEVARHGDPVRSFMNVNSPEDLELAESYAQQHAASPDGVHRRQEE